MSNSSEFQSHTSSAGGCGFLFVCFCVFKFPETDTNSG